MKPFDVQGWLDRYIGAWRTYDPEAIRSLFTEKASYSYHPWDEPLKGADAIAKSWLSEKDPPDSWEASYQPGIIEGNRAIATGTTTYADGRVFWNMWELEFDGGGKCSRFVEWFMLQSP